MKPKRRPQRSKDRSRVAQEAWFQTGGGFHGGSAERQNRRARRAAKQTLRSERVSDELKRIGVQL